MKDIERALCEEGSPHAWGDDGVCNVCRHTKLFRLCKPGTNEDVFGGVIQLTNAYIWAYPNIKGKSPTLLEVGEHTEADYSLSGAKGTYWIVRVQ